MPGLFRAIATVLVCFVAPLSLAAPALADTQAESEKKQEKEKSEKAEPYPPPGAPLRPPPFKDDIPTPSLPPVRHLEISVGPTVISRPAADTIAFGAPARTTYSPTVGFYFALRYPIFKYLSVGAFLDGGLHHIDFSPGALGINGTIKSDSLTTIWFGAKAYPMLPVGKIFRFYGVAGVGWGRFEFPQMTAQEPGRDPFTIKGRGSSFVTFPLGFGTSIEVLKNWLAVDMELDWSPNIHKDGTSFVIVQAIDNGQKRDIGPMPIVHVTFTQSVALTLLL